MATLHELMLVRQMFEKISNTGSIITQVNELVGGIEKLNSINVSGPYQSELIKINLEAKEIEDCLLKIANSKSNLLEIIEKSIKEKTAKFGNDDYEGIMNAKQAARLTDPRPENVSTEVETKVTDRLKTYNNWQYPCLEIGPRKGKWTHHLVAFEPVYIADIHNRFLIETIETFNPEFQKRIRPYVIRDCNLSKLPQNQFGFVFSWGFFNYVTLNSFEIYLTQIFNLLRPGGTFMFSYNNADLPRMARFADGFEKSYAPLTLLQPMFERIGFVLKNSADIDPSGSWLEIAKPGELTSIKRGAILGEIINITY